MNMCPRTFMYNPEIHIYQPTFDPLDLNRDKEAIIQNLLVGAHSHEARKLTKCKIKTFHTAAKQLKSPDWLQNCDQYWIRIR